MSSSARGRNGVLPISPAAMKKSANAHTQAKPAPKPAAPKLRLIVRRLPPGLTETEFWSSLGEEWKVGEGKVDWAAYKEGKISRDPAKPSKPGRAYLRVKEQGFLDTLNAKVRQTVFQDAKSSTKDPCLIGPPSLEFAPLNKVPGGRIRHDGRQGTIDQDQEFIDFLQGLTEPTPRPTTQGGEAGDAKSGKATTTPLIQYIKEKKAAKAKEAALAKSAKGRQDAKDAKGGKSEQKASAGAKGSSSPAVEKTRLARATQESVKAINKSVATIQSKAGSQKADPKPGSAKDTLAAQTPAKRERERGNASVAARILQRDLGLVPKESRANRTTRNPGPTEDAEKTPKVSLPSSTSASTTPQSQAPVAPPAGPRGSRTASAASTKPTQAPTAPQRAAKPPPQPSASAKSAFLKHANPSQGVTEELLRTAFEVFGTLTKCEIDKKKGFGYVDFADNEGLRKAMQASPVKVANSQVVVLENKSRPQSKPAPTPPTTATPATQVLPEAQNVVMAPDNAATAPAASPATAKAPIPTPPATAETSAPPTAPKGTARGSAVNARGNRGGNFGGANRGNFGPANRGGQRGGFRGGRAGGPARGGGRGGNGNANSPAQVNATPAAPASTAASTAEAK